MKQFPIHSEMIMWPFRVINVPMRGVRIYHEKDGKEFVEWPMVAKNGAYSLVQYDFDGEASSGLRWHQLPREVRFKAIAMMGQ